LCIIADAQKDGVDVACVGDWIEAWTLYQRFFHTAAAATFQTAAAG
jgi:hypothetical protein